jgi:hypothetical protein
VEKLFSSHNISNKFKRTQTGTQNKGFSTPLLKFSAGRVTEAKQKHNWSR